METGAGPRSVVLPLVFVVLVVISTWAYVSALSGIGSWVALAAVGVAAFHLRDVRQPHR